MVSFACPSCGTAFQGKASNIGRRFCCPRCKTEFRISVDGASGAAREQRRRGDKTDTAGRSGPAAEPLELEPIFDDDEVEPVAGAEALSFESSASEPVELDLGAFLGSPPQAAPLREPEPSRPKPRSSAPAKDAKDAKAAAKKREAATDPDAASKGAGKRRQWQIGAAVGGAVVLVLAIVAFWPGGETTPSSPGNAGQSPSPANAGQSPSQGITGDAPSPDATSDAPVAAATGGQNPPAGTPGGAAESPATKDPTAPAAADASWRNYLRQARERIDANPSNAGLNVLAEIAAFQARQGDGAAAKATLESYVQKLSAVPSPGMEAYPLEAAAAAFLASPDRSLGEAFIAHVPALAAKLSEAAFQPALVTLADHWKKANREDEIKKLIQTLTSVTENGRLRYAATVTLIMLGVLDDHQGGMDWLAGQVVQVKDRFPIYVEVVMRLTNRGQAEAARAVLKKTIPLGVGNIVARQTIGPYRDHWNATFLETILTISELEFTSRQGGSFHVMTMALAQEYKRHGMEAALKAAIAKGLVETRVPGPTTLEEAIADPELIDNLMGGAIALTTKAHGGYGWTEHSARYEAGLMLIQAAQWSALTGQERIFASARESLRPLMNTSATGSFCYELIEGEAVMLYRVGRENDARSALELHQREFDRQRLPLSDGLLLLKSCLGQPPMGLDAIDQAPVSPRRAMLTRGFAMCLLQRDDLPGALQMAVRSDETTLAHVISQAAARGMGEVDAARAKAGSPALEARILLGQAMAAANPRPAAGFFDPRPVPFPRGLAVNAPRLTPEQRIARWLKMLADPDPDRRRTAIALMESAGGDAWPALTKLAQVYDGDASPEIRLASQAAIRQITADMASKFVARKPPPEAVAAAAGIMVGIGNINRVYDPTWKGCMAVLELADPVVAASAALPAMVKLVRPGYFDEASKLVERLASAVDNQTVTAVATIAAEGDSEAAQGAVAILLIVAGSRDLKATFTSLLAKDDPAVRRRLEKAVRGHENFTASTMASLLPLLSDRSPDLRVATAEWMAFYLSSNNPRLRELEKEATPIVKPAFDALRTDPDLATRLTAVRMSDLMRLPPRPDGSRPPTTSNVPRQQDKMTSVELIRILRATDQSERSREIAIGQLDSKDVGSLLMNISSSWSTVPDGARQLLAARFRSAGQAKGLRRPMLDILKVERDGDTRANLQSVMAAIENAEETDATGGSRPAHRVGGEPSEREAMDERIAAAQLANTKTTASERTAALSFLAEKKAKDARSVQLYRAALTHRHYSVRQAGVRALTAVGDASTAATLLQVMGDWNDAVRLAAVSGVATIAPDAPQTITELAKYVDDPSRSVRYVVDQVLADHGSTPALVRLIDLAWGKTPTVKMDRALRVRNQGLELVLSRLSAEQRAAVATLPASLMQDIASSDRNEQVRAIEFLELLGGAAQSALPALARVARSNVESARLPARFAMADIALDHAPARQLLVDLATDASNAWRAEAVTALNYLGESAKPLVPAIRQGIAKSKLSDKERADLESAIKSIEAAKQSDAQRRRSSRHFTAELAEVPRYDLPGIP